MTFQLQQLPVASEFEIETPAVLRKLASAHRRLAELKGAIQAIPNELILINTLSLQEAKDSSAIENIITTEDELFQSDADANQFPNVAAKEVHRYAAALKIGLAKVRAQGFLRLDDILEVHAALEDKRTGLRKIPGTVLRNSQTGQAVYTPPQDATEIEQLMSNFLAYFHDETATNIDPREMVDPLVEPDPLLNIDPLVNMDPLVKMAILHYQFESIHPFYDGNGRTGRILNLLYLVLHGLLDIPVLYLSRYIVRNKAEYYAGLQAVRDENAWEQFVMYMLTAVEETAIESLLKVKGIKNLMVQTEQKLRNKLPKIYSQDLLNNLFRHPYTRTEFIVRDLNVSRPTATKYLTELEKIGTVRKTKIGRTNYFINEALFKLLMK
ncbi:MAG: Fic family protein [Ignavibacteria bacterium]|nr:Fic family protein [Ignavibacteria bacterium]